MDACGHVQAMEACAHGIHMVHSAGMVRTCIPCEPLGTVSACARVDDDGDRALTMHAEPFDAYSSTVSAPCNAGMPSASKHWAFHHAGTIIAI